MSQLEDIQLVILTRINTNKARGPVVGHDNLVVAHPSRVISRSELDFWRAPSARMLPVHDRASSYHRVERPPACHCSKEVGEGRSHKGVDIVKDDKLKCFR